MASTLRTEGVNLQPITVTDVPKKRPKAAVGKRYRVVFGHLRVAGASLIEKEDGKAYTLRAIYRPAMTETEIARLRAVENIGRQELDAIDTTKEIALLLATSDVHDVRQGLGYPSEHPVAETDRIAYIAATLGRPVRWVSDYAFLARLSEGCQAMVRDGRLPLQFARKIAELSDQRDQDDVARDAAADPNGHRHCTLAAIGQRVDKMKRALASTPWLHDATFGGCPACDGCPDNSENRPMLFPDAADEQKPTCLQPACHGKKTRAAESMITRGIDRVRAAIKDGADVALTVKGVAAYTPKAIKPSTFARRCKSFIDPAKPDKKPAAAKPTTNGRQSIPYDEDPDRVAQQAAAKAVREWEASIDEPINEWMRKHPIHACAIGMICRLPDATAVIEDFMGERGQVPKMRKAPWKKILDRIRAVERGDEDRALQTIKTCARMMAPESWRDACSSNYHLSDPVWLSLVDALAYDVPERPDTDAIAKEARDKQVAKLQRKGLLK